MLGLCMGFSFPAVSKCTSLAVAASAAQLLEMCYHIVTGFYNLPAFLPPTFNIPFRRQNSRHRTSTGRYTLHSHTYLTQHEAS